MVKPINLQELRKKNLRIVRIVSLSCAAGFVLVVALLVLNAPLGLKFLFFSPFLLLSFGLLSFLPFLHYRSTTIKSKSLMFSYGVDRRAEQSFEREVANGRAMNFKRAILTDNWLYDKAGALLPLREIVEVRRQTQRHTYGSAHRIAYMAQLHFSQGDQLTLDFGPKSVLSGDSSAERDQFIAQLQQRCPGARLV